MIETAVSKIYSAPYPSEALINAFNFFSFCLSKTELPKRMTLPYLFLSCENDPTTPSQISDKQGEHCDNLTTKSFPTGHWLLEEDPKGAWAAIEAWLPTVLRE